MGKGVISRPHTESQSRGQLSEEVRITSGVPQGSVLGPLLRIRSSSTSRISSLR